MVLEFTLNWPCTYFPNVFSNLWFQLPPKLILHVASKQNYLKQYIYCSYSLWLKKYLFFLPYLDYVFIHQFFHSFCYLFLFHELFSQLKVQIKNHLFSWNLAWLTNSSDLLSQLLSALVKCEGWAFLKCEGWALTPTFRD